MDNAESKWSEQTGRVDTAVEVSSSVSRRSALGAGLAGALISSVCCLLPALALAAGIGGAVGLVQIGRYQPYLLGAGLLLVAGWNWYLSRGEQSGRSGRASYRELLRADRDLTVVHSARHDQRQGGGRRGEVQVDLRSQRVTVTYDPAKTNPEAIKTTLEAAGDTVLPDRALGSDE